MIRGFYTAKSALSAHQEHMNTIANNMANVNTIGFKPMRTAFTDLMYQNLNRQNVEEEIMLGHGVKINKNDVHMAAGALQPTQYPLDFAILHENGFFAVQDDLERIYYTRAGDFRWSLEDDTYYLVDGSNARVLDQDEQPIEMQFDENGDPYLDHTTIGVFSFPNPYALSLTGRNHFAETLESGEPDLIEFPQLKQGYVEASGVEIAKEMADVIESSKAFSFASRMVQVADEVQQTVNALR